MDYERGLDDFGSQHLEVLLLLRFAWDKVTVMIIVTINALVSPT